MYACLHVCMHTLYQYVYINVYVSLYWRRCAYGYKQVGRQIFYAIEIYIIYIKSGRKQSSRKPLAFISSHKCILYAWIHTCMAYTYKCMYHARMMWVLSTNLSQPSKNIFFVRKNCFVVVVTCCLRKLHCNPIEPLRNYLNFICL